MGRNLPNRYQIPAIVSGVVVVAALATGAILWAQPRLTEPVYRVQNDRLAQQQPPASAATKTPPASALAAANPAAPAASSPFDFAQRPEEHPLMPLIRQCKASVEHIDKNMRDYSCTLVKQERLQGELGEQQFIAMKLRHEPFSVSMEFDQPNKGRQVRYVAGQNNGDLQVKEPGLKGLVGWVSLHPEGAMAMDGQKHPITRVGIRNLLVEIIRVAEADTKYQESVVTVHPGVTVNKRMCTMVKIVHPVARQNFRAFETRIFFDHELRVPIHYDAKMWPAKAGEAAPLEETYTYVNLKANNGFTEKDFSTEK